MNRYDAHLIAEELMKLMPRDYSKDCILDAEQLAGRLGVSAYNLGEEERKKIRTNSKGEMED